MPECETIQGLVLDTESQSTIDRINKKLIFSDALAGVVSLGVFSSIFTRNSSIQVSYNITQTGWILYSNAMNAIPKITKRAIEKEVEAMIVHYHMHYEPKQLKFWEGISSGCK